ncbi:sulfotransferase [Streptomyces sp. NPDC127051]|uniref:sulfotransferase n=1 Tax=Streptomyces sp. NPDC127051 TaxID=3347119 RepID=UPI0036507A24
MNYRSLLIVTYGRSGSTLLQGLLNSIEGCEMRGENYNFCYGLFQSYKCLVGTTARALPRVETPWFGTHWSEDVFLRDVRDLVCRQLIGSRDARRLVRCYGFKEIRYADLAEKDLVEYLDFLVQIFPRPALVFNTRDLHDVVRSDWWQQDPAGSWAALARTDAVFRRYAAERADCFVIDYSDVVGRTLRLRQLFSFLGAPYDEAAVEGTLAVRHSYPSKRYAAAPFGQWPRTWPPEL